MRYACFYTRTLRSAQGVIAHRLVVRMHNGNVGVGGEYLLHVSLIVGIVNGIQPGRDVDVPAHAAYLLVVVAGLRLVDKKVELQHIAVYPTVIVHEHRFNARSVHVADRM